MNLFQQYNKVVQDPHQPLLVTKPKRKFGPGGKKLDDRPILLLPELCYMTGMMWIIYSCWCWYDGGGGHVVMLR
jgi:hypothetical protein